jgi:phage gp36-like protein
MAFLKEEDYPSQLRAEIADILENTGARSDFKLSEDKAIAQMKNYLGGRYDLDLIFVDAPGTGEDETRDMHIVMLAIDITLYHLWSKEGGNNIPQTRIDRYADSLEWLKAIQGGAYSNLPPITDPESGEEKPDIRIWSKHEPESNRY